MWSQLLHRLKDHTEDGQTVQEVDNLHVGHMRQQMADLTKTDTRLATLKDYVDGVLEGNEETTKAREYLEKDS